MKMKEYVNNTHHIDDKYYAVSMAFVNIHEMSKSELLNKSFDTIFDLITEAEKGSFYEIEGDNLTPIMSKGYDLNLLERLKFKKSEAFIGYHNSEGEHLDSYVVRIDKRDDHLFNDETIETFKQLGTYEKFISLYAPIKVGHETVGLICFENFKNQCFSNESQRLLQIFAQQLSNIYTRTYYQEKSEKRYRNIISSLVRSIEVKDTYTRGHAERVKNLSIMLAKELNLAQSYIETIRSAAILHDIGKIGIPTELLNKKGKLTDEEYEVIKQHPMSSKKILDEIDGFSDVTEMAYCHHEHYDGSGYPRGLSGDEIPIGAQIIQLADAYDAMTSDRAYRKAFSNEKALNIIKSERGKQFTPSIVDALFNLIDSHEAHHFCIN